MCSHPGRWQMPIWKDQKAGPPVAGRRCYPCKSCDSAYIEYKGKLRSHRTISMAPGLFRVCSYMAVLHDVQFHAGILDQVDPALGDIGVGDDDIKIRQVRKQRRADLPEFGGVDQQDAGDCRAEGRLLGGDLVLVDTGDRALGADAGSRTEHLIGADPGDERYIFRTLEQDRKSTRLNSSHL